MANYFSSALNDYIGNVFQTSFTGSTNTTLTNVQENGTALVYATYSIGTKAADSGYQQNGVDISTILQPIAGGRVYNGQGVTYTWVCPANVTSVCVVCIGGGGGGRSGVAGGAGGQSYFNSTATVRANGGSGAPSGTIAGAGGTVGAGTGFSGGNGGTGGASANAEESAPAKPALKVAAPTPVVTSDFDEDEAPANSAPVAGAKPAQKAEDILAMIRARQQK
jgi:hypothetical protein